MKKCYEPSDGKTDYTMVRHSQSRLSGHWLQWIVWLIAASFFLFNYMNQVVPSAMADELSRAFDIHATMLGVLAAVYFYTYAAMQIPVGVVVDYYGPHRSLGIAALLSAIGCLFFSFASFLFYSFFSCLHYGCCCLHP